MAAYADELSILDFLKIAMPHNQNKWDAWIKALADCDIDTVRDLRNLSEQEFEKLPISPLLRSALRKALTSSAAASSSSISPNNGGTPINSNLPPPFQRDDSIPPPYDGSHDLPLVRQTKRPNINDNSNNNEQRLIGGFLVGEQIVSGVNFSNTTMTISVGDVGVVCGPCNNNTLSDANERLLCAFPRGKVNLRVLSLSRPDQLLAGGYRVGDAVVSGITDEALNLAIGDEGVVCGPCNNDKLTLVDERLCCSFPRCSQVNITVLSISRAGQLFQGGYRVGDKIVSGVDYTDEKGRLCVRVGDPGVISGPCNNVALKDAHERLHCTFAEITLNVRVLDLSRPGQVFAGGYHVGDRVRSSIAYKDETHDLQVGDVGIVCSGCNANTLSDMDLRVCCSFSLGGRVNLLITNITRVDTNIFSSKEKTH